jgi:CubicO group peptidase (beta-lactamase class C family)
MTAYFSTEPHAWPSQLRSHPIYNRKVRLLTFLLVAVRLFGQSIDSAAVDGIVRDALAASHTPGAAVAIVKDDRVVYMKGHGVRELGRPQPVTQDSLFCVGSLTKAFTATSIAMLIDEGKMAWDDPVRKHLDYFHLADPLADANVTVRDLLTHRAGLGTHDFLWMDAPWSLEESIRRIGKVAPSFSFRSTYHYQNMMYNAAGYALAYASGGAWQDFVRARIFEPLGMSGVKFTATEAQQSADHASPHLKSSGGKVEITTWYQDDKQIRAAGSIKAGVRDLSQWMRFQLGDGTFGGKRLVSQNNLMETHTAQIVIPRWDKNQMFAAYGMGWRISDYRGHLLFSHSGSVKGFHAYLALLPNEKLGIVVLSNLNASWMPEAATENIADLLLELPKRNRNAQESRKEQIAEAARKERELAHDRNRRKDTQPSRDLAAYTGVYEEPAYGAATVSLENGRLAIRWSSFHAALEHYHYDTFDLRGERRMPNEQALFSLKANGDVAAMTFLGMEFKKAPAGTKGD